MKKKVFALFFAACTILLVILIITLHRRSEHVHADVKPFITAIPFDLAQTQAISQFRSCEGHNYSGKNVHGIEETYRTMKHYIEVKPSFDESIDKVAIYAPFDGQISNVYSDARGSQVYVSPHDDTGWDFIFFHVDLLPQFGDEGAEVAAGQHIGFANLEDAANYDMAMRWFGFGPQRNASPFTFMTADTLAHFARSGITLDTIIISKEDRDAVPCTLAPGQSGRDAFYAQSEAGKNWINLEHE